MISSLRAFFNAMFGSFEHEGGYVALGMWPGGFFSKNTEPTQAKWFSWPDHQDTLIDFCEKNADKDVLFVPALFATTDSRKSENILHQCVVYADADSAPLESFRIPPSITVKTSPGKHHLYWLTDANDPQLMANVSRNIARAHRNEGCDWVGGAKLLRVPGTANNKYGRGEFVVEIVGGNEVVYNPKDFEEPYGPPVTPEKSVSGLLPGRPLPQKDWPSQIDAANWMKDHPEVEKVYSIQVSKGMGDRSRLLWRVLHTLRRAEATPGMAMRIAWDCGSCKYRQDGKGIEPLWRDLCKAWEEISPDSDDPRTHDAEKFAREISKRVSFLDDAERKLVPHDMLVDEYVEWATEKTGGVSPQFHLTGIMTLLSAVFGEYGECPTPFPLNLTLWFIIAGPTTRTRKSTSQRLWVELLKQLEDEESDEDYDEDSGEQRPFDYNINSDVTSEALSQELLKRKGLTTVFYRDEAHGLLSEQSAKRHMVGLREHFTELYDGIARSRLRVTSGIRMKETRCNFVLHLCGTMEGLTEIFTTKDFSSGHIPRFLIAHSEGEDLSRASTYIPQMRTRRRAQDESMQRLAERLKDARDFWEQQTERGDPLMIPFAEDAWERWNDLNWQMMEISMSSDIPESLTPTADRMAKSIMKVAILLAMSAKRLEVSLLDVLKAATMAEQWYKSMVTVAGKIRATNELKNQDVVLDYIEDSANGRTRDEVFRKFRGQFEGLGVLNLVRQLEISGLISVLGAVDGKAVGKTRYVRSAIPR